MKKNWTDTLNYLGKNKTPFFFIVDFEGVNSEIFLTNELNKQNVFFDFSNNKNIESTTNQKIKSYPIDFKDFKIAFDKVLDHLRKGDSSLINLTFATPIEPVNLQEVYKIAKAKYKVLYKNNWVCFSPETFIKISDNQIFTYPMKGTINAGLPDAENILLNNKKEKEEHKTIVDLLCKDLEKVSDNIEVTKFRYVEKIKRQQGEILQTSSEIKGDLQDNWNENLGTILSKLLPAGSIFGAPKEKSWEIINEAETYHRGYYTGIAGFFDGKTFDSCVLIRFIENIDNQYFYKSGGGITVDSKPEAEYDEVQQKIYIPC